MPSASSTSVCRLASVPLSHVRSTRAAGDGALEDLVFGPGRGRPALVVDEPGEQPAAPALHLRVHAAPRRRGADHRVRLEMAEPLPGSDRLGPVRDGHAHRDARPARLPALFLVRRFLPRARYWRRSSARCGSVDPLVEHSWLIRIDGSPAYLQPSLDQFRAPPLRSESSTRREAGPSPCDAACGIRAGAGPPSSARPAPNRARTRGPRPGLQPFRPVGTVRPVLIGREPRAASARVTPWTCPDRFPPRSAECSDAVRNAASRSGSSPRQVRILLTHECNTFLS